MKQWPLTAQWWLPLVLIASACHSSTRPSPTASLVVTPAGQAIVGVTRLRFSGAATGLVGDSLRYEWSFGDGTTGDGALLGHVFQTAGTFDVTLTASDARGGAASAGARVTVRSLDGAWSDPTPGPAGYGLGFNLAQRGNELESDINSPGNCPNFEGGPPWGTLHGYVEDPRAVRWTLVCVVERHFTGVADDSLNSITGRYDTGRTVTYFRH